MRDALIEAMALAIYKSEPRSQESDGYWHAGVREYWTDQAAVALDAALSLLESPSDEMVEAGAQASNDEYRDDCKDSIDRPVARNVWTAMLNTLKAHV